MAAPSSSQHRSAALTAARRIGSRWLAALVGFVNLAPSQANAVAWTAVAAAQAATAASGAPPAGRPPDSGASPGRDASSGPPPDRAALEAAWASAVQRCNRHPVAAVRKQCLNEARREYDAGLARLR